MKTGYDGHTIVDVIDADTALHLLTELILEFELLFCIFLGFFLSFLELFLFPGSL
eukprot:CAMPEP_0114594706 /NCGR_PEP_ID=MMETSP0125-20121206/16395_1 /TAXON_ID=485358 ORGANISM="Aristerostoma sp., Strain ATCC 50986" /NCGR_SAMPLE_ID=MMETSP0125 /ASSEMBLY_ACC=CAM_ASM_000245 /LENGTH=54 /DNA_ID=CAMNT_0001795343 /DNA_START=1 /DNA_END=161 /DNA_ORIENTATION=+